MSATSSSTNGTLSHTQNTIFSKEYLHNIAEINKMQVRKRQILHHIALLQRANNGHDTKIALLLGKLDVKDNIIQELKAEVLKEFNAMEARLQRLLD
ncbi:hypothetical protein O181_107774 [Austropuccinia psidii MF-1]|uniref:Uncharacterized protein n=1 Tax=Austropuccinia psidii MF-1 TaxID=1389203 RepID=A0A9Q3JUS5_9BASI|nr:hypothetical protein [Austropuccinia psidii MF-1]